MKYQLATEYTSFVVVAERVDGEKAIHLPATVAVPHMLAAGWGASAQVVLSGNARVMAAPKLCAPTPREAGGSDVLAGRRFAEAEPMDEFDFDIPEFLRRDVDEPVTAFDSSERAALLQSLMAAHGHGEPLPTSLTELARTHPLPPDVAAALRQIIADTGKEESDILQVFFALLAEDDAAYGLDLQFRGMLCGTVLGSRAHRGLRSVLMAKIFQ